MDPDELLAVLSDLSTYPRWLDIVRRAVPEPDAERDPERDPERDAASGAEPAWQVDLGGQLGPFRRSKRLRMVRRVATGPDTVVFQRHELDGRQHSDWTMTATLRRGGADGPVGLRIRLHYGGSLWVPLLDRLLAEEIERSRGRLVEIVRAPG